MVDAREWASSAMSKRPWREEFFQRFSDELSSLETNPLQVLELGSGPGFLAQSILQALPTAKYTMLDFSPAMHDLARERLGSMIGRACQVQLDFKQDNWCDGLGPFDAVVTNQAVHELRHKRHVPALHRAVRSVLEPHGVYLVCDHYVGGDGMSNSDLYMTVEEQRTALESVGFGTVTKLLEKGGLVLHRAVI